MRTMAADDPQVVVQAVSILAEGGTVVYPTDTLYGLGASLQHPEAIMRTFDLKGMEPAPHSLIMSNLEMAEEYVKLSDLARQFFGKFPAGPFTFLLPVRDRPRHDIPAILIKEGKVGIRIPLHAVPRQIAVQIGPITSTSANVHGDVPPKGFKDVCLAGADLYIDDGGCLYGDPSTILTQDGDELVILRQGALERIILQRFMGDLIG